MKTRIISAVVAFVILIPILWFSDTVIFPLAMAACSAIAAFELTSCVGTKQWYLRAPSVALAFAGPLLTEWLAPTVERYILLLALASFVYFFLFMMIAVITGGKLKYSAVAETVLGVVYATVGFSSIALIRGNTAHGVWLFGLVFVAAWMTDTMAYFTGRFFGKHKLCPKISPKKTIEGSIGGTVFCALSFLLYGFIAHKASHLNPNYVMLAVSGLVLSVISQFGDLAASLIKREHGVKDYGKIMPGHGGVMDRFDSILAVAPFLLMISEFSTAFSFFS